MPQYYVEGSHAAIIGPAEWQLVQMEIQRRKNTGRSYNCCSPFSEALGILMADRETVIADCRAVMEALADCGSINTEMEAVSDEMEMTAGLIQKMVDESATRKLDQHDYRKKYDGYASRYAALESRMDSLEKERESKEIQYDIFSGFLAGLRETEELPVDFNEGLFHRLVDYATV